MNLSKTEFKCSEGSTFNSIRLRLRLLQDSTNSLVVISCESCQFKHLYKTPVLQSADQTKHSREGKGQNSPSVCHTKYTFSPVLPMKFKHKVMSKMFDGDRNVELYTEKGNQSVLSVVPVLSRKYLNLHFFCQFCGEQIGDQQCELPCTMGNNEDRITERHVPGKNQSVI